jgi:DNA-binding beta-propeller fold protein YncE
MGLLLFIASLSVGYCLVKQFLNFSRPLVSFCGAAIVGCLLSGTTLYLIDFLCVKIAGEYFAGTLLFLAAAFAYVFYSHKRFKILSQAKIEVLDLFRDKAAILTFAVFLIFSIWINWHSLSLTQSGNIMVANGAWSDIIYHHAYVRSVVFGENVPIQYPYFANEPIHYHFLFDYYVGKISQLGLNSVVALNIMSAVGMLCLLLLIFEFGRLFFKSSLTGFLGALFLIFHSSFSAFPWLAKNFDENLLQKIVEKSGWVVGAAFEDWGLFNLNVFINQRHLPFTLAFIVLLVIFVFEYCQTNKATGISTENGGDGFFCKYAIDVNQIKLPLFWILIIGAMPFWNVLFSVMCIAFLGAFAVINYKKRSVCVGLLITAFVSFLIVYPQLLLFKSGDSALIGYPILHFGYALSEFSLIEFILYYWHVWGFKLILTFVTLLFVGWRVRLYFLVLLIPFVIANTLQLGTVLYDNNKLIFVSLIFINCYAAYSIALLAKKHRVYFALPAIILIISVTAAGVLDFFAIKNIPKTEMADQTSDFKSWIIDNTKPKSVFLTNDSVPYSDSGIAAINLAGRYLYAVSSCVSSSCDVNKRIAISKRIYSFEGGVEQTMSLLKQEKIDYVLIDDLVKNNALLKVNKKAFADNFEAVYQEQGLIVYQVPANLSDIPVSRLQKATAAEVDTTIPAVNAFEGGSGRGGGQFDKPRGVAVDMTGNLYVADFGNSRIQKFSPEGNFLTAFGIHGSGEGELREPNGITVDAAGNVYVADSLNHHLIKFKADGTFEKQWSGPPPTFYGPRDVAIGPNKQLYVLDQGRSRIVTFDPESENYAEWGRNGTGDGEFTDATGIDVAGERVFVADAGNKRIQVFDLSGKFIRQWAVSEWNGQLGYFPDVAFDAKANRVYATSGLTKEVVVFDADGNRLDSLKSALSDSLDNPSSLTLADIKGEKRLYVLDTGDSSVSVFELGKAKPKK